MVLMKVVISRIHFTKWQPGKTMSGVSKFFLNYDGDPLFPPEGEAAQGVYPPDPQIKMKVFKAL
jgi:hypothetical protein